MDLEEQIKIRTRMQNMNVSYIRRANLAFELLFQGKWRIQILSTMRSGPIRLGQLARLLPGASKKMLTQNLRKLEADGIVVRKDMSDVVLHIEYEVSNEIRDGVYDLLDHLVEWADVYLSTSEIERRSGDS